MSVPILNIRQSVRRAPVGPPTPVEPPETVGSIDPLSLTIGQPFSLDVRPYFSGATTYAFSPSIPGLSLMGGILSGTPLGPVASGPLTITGNNSSGVPAEQVTSYAVEAGAATPTAHIVALLGQSNLQILTADGAGNIDAGLPKPLITRENLRVIRPTTNDAATAEIKDTLVTQALLDSNKINPAMGAASEWLHHVAPGEDFIVLELAEGGTSRSQLATDANPTRPWAILQMVVDYCEANYGTVDQVIEMWNAHDQGRIAQFLPNFAPLYFGQYADGTTFDLGTAHSGPQVTTVVDHCFWDADAPADQKGRGVFTRANTRWTYLVNHDKDNSPDRFAGYQTFWADPRVQEIAAEPGVWFGLYSQNDGAHADTASFEGQVRAVNPVLIQMARMAGVAIQEPTVQSVDVAVDGSYADVTVSLPNSGSLTTIRALDGIAPPADPIHWLQPLHGIEVRRFGDTARKYLSRSAESDQPVAYRGSVVVQDAAAGVIRVTPDQSFATGDLIYPIWSERRDDGQYPGEDQSNQFHPDLPHLDLPVESVPGLRNSGGLHKLGYVPVRPYTPAHVVALPTPFIARSAVLGEGGYLADSPMAEGVPGSSEGTVSAWFRHGGTWNSTSRARVFELRAGANPSLSIRTYITGRAEFVLGSSLTYQAPNNTFEGDRWHHVLWTYKSGQGGWNRIYVDGSGTALEGPDLTEANLLISGTVNRAGVGSETSGGSYWTGEIGHLYINLQTAMDFTDPANRAKFISGGAPVDLGAIGQIPTGDAPAFYFDGDGSAWNNRGYAGSLTAHGTLAAGGVPALP